MPEKSLQPQIQKCAALVFLLALTCCTAPAAFSQGWLRHYPSGQAEEPRQLVVEPNGDFVFGGIGYSSNPASSHFYLQRNDANGNPIWYKTIQVNGLAAVNPNGALNFLERCPGGGYIGGGSMKLVHGYQSEILFRVSESGDSLWTYQPDPDRRGFLQALAVAPDGNLLVGGARDTAFQSQSTLKPHLYKINPADGSVIWEKSYPDYPGTEVLTSILYAPDGSILEAGINLIRHLDAEGNLLQTFDIGPTTWVYPILRRAESDGFSFICVRDENVVFRRYDYDGNLLVSNTTDSIVIPLNTGTETGQGFAFSFTPLQDQGPNYLTPVLYKMDLAGNIGAPIFPLEDFSLASVYLSQNVKATPDSGFLFIGANLGQPTWFALKTDGAGQIDGGFLTGNVFRDNDADCQKSPGEPTLQPVALLATDLDFGSEWYETTDSAGNFTFQVPIGDYEIEALPPGGAAGAWQPCPPVTGLLSVPSDTAELPPVGLQPQIDCPFLQLDLGAWVFRPCSTTVMTVSVLNAGPVGTDSSIVVLEADPALTYTDSSIPLLSQNGNQLWFDAGPVEALQSVAFTVSFAVDCAAQLGQVVCVDGHISPDSLCAPPSPLWDGAELKVRALCDDDTIRFRVSNVGAGDMNQATDLVIIEDYIILFSIPLQLPAGADSLISLPNPDGQTYYGRISQTPGFPGEAFASDGKDFCTASGAAGMLLQYPLFTGGPFDARFCDEVRTAFDPNDKRGFPLGYGSAHYIDRGIPIRYLVRFQNTGNDTAFLVLVRDSLPPELDLSTLRIGSASHPVTWKLSGAGILEFRFANILLPGSTTNEPASHGFVQFSVTPKADLPPGTTVRNRAAIYFDVNAPVFTDYARHTVDSNFIPVRALGLPAPALHFSVSPNPAGRLATFNWEAVPGIEFPLLLTISDLWGNALRQESVFEKEYLLRRGNLPAGLCFLSITDRKGTILGAGKVIWLDD